MTIRQNDIHEPIDLPSEMHMIGLCVHEKYETHDSDKHFTEIFYRGEILTEVANVRVYAGWAIDCDSDRVPFTVVVTRTKYSYQGHLHQGGNDFPLFDTDKVENLLEAYTIEKIRRGEY